LPRSRATSFLAEPPEPADLVDSPAHLLLRGGELHRIHRREREPWYFDDGPLSRFSLCLLPGRGTCYLAEVAVTCLLEVFKGIRMVDELDVRSRAHLTVTNDRELRLASCSDEGASRFGVNAEIHTTTDHAKTQRWARAFALAGFDGVRYLVRSDPAARLVGVALFDGRGVPARGRWPAGRDAPISDDLLTAAEGYGLRVLPSP
jgi:hypothetical protein